MSDPTPAPNASPGPRKPDPAGPAGGPGAGGKPPLPRPDKAPDFRVIRSAPPPESDAANMMPLVVGLVVVIALAIGGYWYSQRPATDDDPGKTGTNGATTTTSTGPKAENAPDSVFERPAYLENEGRLADAIAFLRDKLKDYPDAPNIKAEIARLEERSGITPQNPADVMAGAARKLEARQYQEALDDLEGMTAELPDTQEGQRQFLMAVAYAGLGNKLDAGNCLETAAQKGYPEGEIKRLRDQLR